MGPVSGEEFDDPIDRLILNLRAYSEPRKAPYIGSHRPWDSEFAIVFDTETTTDPSQRLRFGAYQVRQRGHLLERGVFYADDIPPADLEVLRSTFEKVEPTEAGEKLAIRSRAGFVEHVLFEWGWELNALIIGFNLPFDISRLAVDHSYAKGRFKGGFSFSLAEGRPNIRVKHLSQRAAFIDFAGKDGFDLVHDRGLFVDVKTLAAALTSASHSLARAVSDQSAS